MISRSQRPTQGALNQRGGSGGFRLAQMSFISSRSVAFKVAMSNLIDFYISPPLESAAEHESAEFFVGIDHNRSELYSGLGYYNWPTLTLYSAFFACNLAGRQSKAQGDHFCALTTATTAKLKDA